LFPYQRATGALAPDGSIDWLTGEAAIAVSWCVVCLLLAIVAAWVIRRDYSGRPNIGPAPT